MWPRGAIDGQLSLTWPRSAIDGQLSLDWTRSAIVPRNMALSLIWICRIQWWCSLFSFSVGNTLFGQIWSKKIKIVSFETWYHAKFEYAEFNDALHFFCFGPEIPFWSKSGRKKKKIVSLRWNLILRLIWICKIQWWCSLFTFSTGNTLFGEIWSKKSKWPV